MLKMSQSFCMGTGGIEHNLRIKKGVGVRQNGVLERRFLNEYPVMDKELINNSNYVQQIIHNAVEPVVKDGLEKVNQKHISNRQLCRVKTVKQWIESQQYTRNGKLKPIIREIVIQVGNKFTGCPFEYETNKNGNMVDKDGKEIPLWDTRKKLIYKNGKITESAICKKLKKVYKEFLNEFIKANPQFKIISAAIHADEKGGCHMHINYIAFSHTKNGVGFGLSSTMAIKQQLEKQGIKCKNELCNNPTIKWKNMMRKILEDVCLKNGIERLNMNNHEKHKSIYNFCKDSDARCAAIEAERNQLAEQIKDTMKAKADILTQQSIMDVKNVMLNAKESELKEKEDALSLDIAKQEWYILKKQFPKLYQQVHTLYMQNKNKKQKGIYNSNEL